MCVSGYLRSCGMSHCTSNTPTDDANATADNTTHATTDPITDHITDPTTKVNSSYADPLAEHIRAYLDTKHISAHPGAAHNPYRMAADVHQRSVHVDGGRHLESGHGMPAWRIRAGHLHHDLGPGLPAMLTELPSWNVQAGGVLS